MGAPALFRHPMFRRLADADRVLVLYLLFGPQANRIGCFALSVSLMAEDLDRPVPTVVDSLLRMCSLTGWRYDPTSRVLLIPTWWYWFLPASEREFRLALTDWASVPDTSALRQHFLGTRKFVPERWHGIFEALAQGVSPMKRTVVVEDAPSTVTLFDGGAEAPDVLISTDLENQILRLWNESVTFPIPKAKKTDRIKKLIHTRIKEHPKLTYFRMVFEEVNGTPYCRGESDMPAFKGFVADLGYVLKKAETFERFLTRAHAREAAMKTARVQQAAVRVANCRHTPACGTSIECTRKMLAEM